MNKIFDYVKSENFYKELAESIKNNKRICLNNSNLDTDIFYLQLISDDFNNKVIACFDEDEIRRVSVLLDFYNIKNEIFLTRDLIFDSDENYDDNIKLNRIKIINKTIENKNNVVVTTYSNLALPVINKDEYSKLIINLSEGGEINIDSFVSSLVDLGYDRVDYIENKGQFTVRGGIVDIFSPINENPIRIELFGNNIESIRYFDIYSYSSIEKIKDVKIFPYIDRLEDEEKNCCFLEYFDEKDLLFISNYSRSKEKLISDLDEYHESSFDKKIKIFEKTQIEEYFKKMYVFVSDTFDDALDIEFSFKEITDTAVQKLINIDNKYSDFIKTLKNNKKKKYKTIIVMQRISSANKIISLLQEEDIYSYIIDDLEREINFSDVVFVRGSISKSFVIDEFKLSVLSFNEITGIDINNKTKKTVRKNSDINELSKYMVGDYVVHENYGIGIYKGIITIDNENINKDYILIEYKNNAKLYISISDLYKIKKYSSRDKQGIILDSLNSKNWLSAKKNAKKNIEEIVSEFVELYAIRSEEKGFKYSEDSAFQKQFEDDFEYEETAGQLKAIEDVKRDMESYKIMDRLICGDVGYGKTEVALRASFKAVMDNKQVAYLTPTTILAEQHYKMFTKRLKSYHVECALLSRSVSKKKQEEIIENLKEGLVDIVIGTHRLLSKDIKYKDLGLLIIDEEQRFGVNHKERIKQIKKDVDVLSLSATPIPRTLHMSLIGVRDISIIDEPPQDRKSVRTYILRKDENVIKDAIKRELGRMGQVYYVYNNIKNIREVTAKLKSFFPNNTVDYIHGRMNEEELENKMNDFINKDIDILVTTTIIETGLDISNVNTLIVENADHMGITTLYQLRGRVGRSERQAYAFFLIPSNIDSSKDSYKRLMAIKRNTEFGSGFNIALEDLRIRGFGSLLGRAQSGHLNRIGYDLYCKMLSDSIKKIKNNEIDEKKDEFDTTVDININSFISDEYEQSNDVKLELYKKISLIDNISKKEVLYKELEDVYGYVPGYIDDLVEVSLIKSKANSLYITEIKETLSAYRIKFYKDAKINTSIFIGLVDIYKDRIYINHSKDIIVELIKEKNDTDKLKTINNLLNNIEILNKS